VLAGRLIRPRCYTEVGVLYVDIGRGLAMLPTCDWIPWLCESLQIVNSTISGWLYWPGLTTIHWTKLVKSTRITTPRIS
jgi:hypothetical protein